MLNITNDYAKFLLLQNASYMLVKKVMTHGDEPVNYQKAQDYLLQLGQAMEAFKLLRPMTAPQSPKPPFTHKFPTPPPQAFPPCDLNAMDIDQRQQPPS